MSKIVVTGAGGFIGGHLARQLMEEGHQVVGVDSKDVDDWYIAGTSNDIDCVDLRRLAVYDIEELLAGADDVFALAADMGGMGFIENHKLECMLSVNISTNTFWAASRVGVKRVFYSSSACVYPGYRQGTLSSEGLREEDAYPADPEDGYGWEKLFSERMAAQFDAETDTEFSVARYHNVYGPEGTFRGGREKAPAAICRKVAEAVLGKTSTIDVWGDGQQIRSYMYIDDCLTGTRRVMDRHIIDPINVGSSEAVSVNQLIEIVEEIAGVKLIRMYDLGAPQGVRGRNSDNTRARAELDWEPSISLREGLERTYAWVYDQVVAGR